VPGTVAIDFSGGSIIPYRHGYAVVVVDVIRATTTAITAVDTGRECFPVPSLEAAWRLAAKLDNPLMVGELQGEIPDGFHLNNSPAELAMRTETSRPMILLSTNGSKLICESGKCDVAYLACFRNYASTAVQLDGRHSKIALIGSSSLGEFREEDQICCAWIAEKLLKAGYKPQNKKTSEIIERWRGSTVGAFVGNNSVAYLRRSGQLRDLEFILTHVNDLNGAYVVQKDRIVVVPSETQSKFP